MKRLTECDEQGNWSLKGVSWEKLHAGAVISVNLENELYGALQKLMEYENTGVTPQKIYELKSGTILKLMSKQWIPVEERLPEDDKYILLSFDNFSTPTVGRYEADESGGAFYLGDEDESCVKQDMYVNAWMPLPEPYR